MRKQDSWLPGQGHHHTESKLWAPGDGLEWGACQEKGSRESLITLRLPQVFGSSPAGTAACHSLFSCHRHITPVAPDLNLSVPRPYKVGASMYTRQAPGPAPPPSRVTPEPDDSRNIRSGAAHRYLEMEGT